MKKFALLILLLITVIVSVPSYASSDKLEQQIKQILDANNTSAASISIIESNGDQYTFGVGISDKSTQKPVDSETLFRIGSVSKIFTTLSVLKLVEENKLGLQDEIRTWVDDVEYDNPWENEHPIRIVHLLSHTTGWSDLHMSEFAHNDPTPLPLQDSFLVYPKSRTSRWIPGTRMAYSNPGPAVAAYIVEKSTGQTYEDYVEANFFKPLNMDTATFFQSDDYVRNHATLYIGDEKQTYWNIIMRPSGSINASANDMIKLLYLFINDSDQNLLSLNSIESMRVPQSSTIAESGLEVGHGLSHFTEVSNGFTWYGHNGGVNGGLSDFKYVPEHGIGYYVAINSADSKAIKEISDLLKAHLTQGLKASIKPYTVDDSVDTESLGGFYRVVNPRNSALYFLEYLSSVVIVESKSEGIELIGNVDGSVNKFKPINSNQFVDPTTGNIALTITEDPLIGTVLQNQTFTLQPVSGFSVFGPIAFVLVWVILTLIVLIRTIVLIILKTQKKQVKGRLWTHLLPLLQILSFSIFTIGFIGVVRADLLSDNRLISNMVAYGPILFLMLSIGSVFWLIFKREKNYSYFQSLIYSIMNLIIGVYLTIMGITGFQFF